MLCYITAPRETSIAHVAIIYAVVPFLTADLVWVMLRERPNRVALVASIAALTGSVVKVGFGHDGTLWGDGLALLMTFGMALLMIIARRHPDIPTMPAKIVSSVLCIALCLPLADLALPETDQLVILAGFGLVNSTLGFSLFLLGSTRIALIETALPGALGAPIAPLWVWLVFAETPTPATIAGGLIVLAAVFWHITRTYRSG